MKPDYASLADYAYRLSESIDKSRFEREARRILPQLAGAIHTLLVPPQSKIKPAKKQPFSRKKKRMPSIHVYESGVVYNPSQPVPVGGSSIHDLKRVKSVPEVVSSSPSPQEKNPEAGTRTRKRTYQELLKLLKTPVREETLNHESESEIELQSSTSEGEPT